MLDVQRLDQLERLAQAQLTPMAYDYIAGGADDEWTLAENTRAFRRWQLVPRMLVDASAASTTTTVLGTPVSLPVLVAPMAFHGLCHPDGELATARGVKAAGTVMIASTVANRSLEEIAAEEVARWFQLYVFKDRGVTTAMIERAAAAGYTALCLTVDTPLVGRRERDVRNSFTLPPGLHLANFAATAADDLPSVAGRSGLAAYVAAQRDLTLGWRDLAWLRERSGLPVVVKGILSPADARLAVEHGAAAIVVSNHGGRQLDGAPAALTMLPAIVEAVAGRCEVLMDGGVRRGTDVLTALALGARAVLLGRPMLWALTLGGAPGVTAALAMLRDELRLAMILAGCPTVPQISAELLLRAER